MYKAIAAASISFSPSKSEGWGTQSTQGTPCAHSQRATPHLLTPPHSPDSPTQQDQQQQQQQKQQQGQAEAVEKVLWVSHIDSMLHAEAQRLEDEKTRKTRVDGGFKSESKVQQDSRQHQRRDQRREERWEERSEMRGLWEQMGERDKVRLLAPPGTCQCPKS